MIALSAAFHLLLGFVSLRSPRTPETPRLEPVAG
jgi:hypothetical protein